MIDKKVLKYNESSYNEIWEGLEQLRDRLNDAKAEIEAMRPLFEFARKDAHSAMASPALKQMWRNYESWKQNLE